jgi:outer membrane lipoprotein SlyB
MAANTVGMLLGGLFGERTANAVMTTAAQEIIAQLVVPGGQPRTVVIVQPAPFDQVFPQESVYVSEVRGTYRVLKRTM